MKQKMKLEIKNARRSSYGYDDPCIYEDREIVKELSPYVVNGYLKTDMESLKAVAEILRYSYGELLTINPDGTFTFYSTDY